MAKMAAKAKAGKAMPPAIKIPLKTLVGLLGKSPKDAAVLTLIGKAGKVSVKPDFIIAKDAGFDFSVDVPDTATKRIKVLTSLFLFRDGKDGHRGYLDLPKGFAFATRDALFAAVGEPDVTWKIGKGKVPASTPDITWDQWNRDGLEITASYSRDTGTVGHFNITLPEEETGGQDLSTYPLHFESKPVDAPKDADLVGMALLVAWAATRVGLPPKHANSAHGKQLVGKKITPRTFLVEACDKTLTSLDFVPELRDFLYEYIHHVTDDEGVREKVDVKIAKLIGYDRPERRAYTDDFNATFKGAVESSFHVPDSWDAVDRIAPVIDARWADYQETKFLAVPSLAPYEKAAKARDTVKITPDRGAAAPAKGAADDKLADELVALIGKAVKDPATKAVLDRAGLPIGKKIDEQANAALGVSYMGTNMQIGGKKQIGVDSVSFYSAKRTSYIRSVGAELEFAAYPAQLPRGLAWGQSRAAVAKLLGKPTDSGQDDEEDGGEARDYWKTKNRITTLRFVKDKLVEVFIGQPDDDY